MDCGMCHLPLGRESHGNRKYHEECGPKNKRKRNKYRVALDSITTGVRPITEIRRTGFVSNDERQALRAIVSVEARRHEERWNRMFRFEKTT